MKFREIINFEIVFNMINIYVNFFFKKNVDIDINA